MKAFFKKRIRYRPRPRSNERLQDVYEKDIDVSDPSRKVSDDEPSFELSKGICRICGTRTTPDGLLTDDRFWIKSATYSELSQGSLSCSFCEILRAVLEKCLGEMLGKPGCLDWGRDPFNLIWYGSEKAVQLEVFCTAGKGLSYL